MKYYYYGFITRQGKNIELTGTNNSGIVELKTLKGVENRIKQYRNNNCFDSYIEGVRIYNDSDKLLSILLF